jgi:hypothetical protein
VELARLKAYPDWLASVASSNDLMSAMSQQIAAAVGTGSSPENMCDMLALSFSLTANVLRHLKTPVRMDAVRSKLLTETNRKRSRESSAAIVLNEPERVAALQIAEESRRRTAEIKSKRQNERVKQFMDERPVAALLHERQIITWSPDDQASFEAKRLLTRADMLNYIRQANLQTEFRQAQGVAASTAGRELLVAFLLDHASTTRQASDDDSTHLEDSDLCSDADSDSDSELSESSDVSYPSDERDEENDAAEQIPEQQPEAMIPPRRIDNRRTNAYLTWEEFALRLTELKLTVEDTQPASYDDLVGHLIAFRWDKGWAIGRVKAQATDAEDLKAGFNYLVVYGKETRPWRHRLNELQPYGSGEGACLGSWCILNPL